MIALSMMGKKAEMRPANLFFVELIIVLLFFSLSAAIILQVFAAADRKQKLGELTERSIVTAQTIAECYSVTGDVAETVEMAFGMNADIKDGAVTIPLNRQLTASAEGDVQLTVSEISRDISEAGVFSRMTIEFVLDDDVLYSLTCSAYTPQNGGVSVE